MKTDIEIEKRIKELMKKLLMREISFLEFSLKFLFKDRRILREISKQISQYRNLVFIYQGRQESLIITTEENSFTFP